MRHTAAAATLVLFTCTIDEAWIVLSAARRAARGSAAGGGGGAGPRRGRPRLRSEDTQRRQQHRGRHYERSAFYCIRYAAGATGEGSPLPTEGRGSGRHPRFGEGAAGGELSGPPPPPVPPPPMPFPPPLLGGARPWAGSSGGSLGLAPFTLASAASSSSQKASTRSSPSAAAASFWKAAASSLPPCSPPLPSWNARQSPSRAGPAAGPAAAGPGRGPGPTVEADPPAPAPTVPLAAGTGAAA